MTERVGIDDGERKILADIKKFGWHAMHILEEGGEPPWTFSIGLFQTWQRPEFLIIGLPRDTAHQILANVVTTIREQRPLDLGTPTMELLETVPLCYVEVPRRHYHDYVGFARWYYEGNHFPLYQIVWPSKEGRFPWSPQATDRFKHWQPVLGTAPIGH